MKSGKTERLIAAIKAGDKAAARAAIEGGADVNFVDRNGDSPLIILAKSSADKEIGLLLIRAGAEIDHKNNRQETATFHAPTRSDLVKLLEKHTHLISLASIGSGAREMAKLLSDPDVFVDVREAKGHTPLMHASFFNMEENVELLLEKGANHALEDNLKSDALSIAIGAENFALALFIVKKQGLTFATIPANSLQALACFYMSDQTIQGIEDLVAASFDTKNRNEKIKLSAACSLLELFYSGEDKAMSASLNIFSLLQKFTGKTKFDEEKIMAETLADLASKIVVDLKDGCKLVVAKAKIKGHSSYFLIKLDPKDIPLEISYMDGACPFEATPKLGQPKRIPATSTYVFDGEKRPTYRQIKDKIAQWRDTESVQEGLEKMATASAKSCFITPQKNGNCVGAAAKVTLEQIAIEKTKLGEKKLSPEKEEEIHQMRKSFFNKLILTFAENVHKGALAGDSRAIEVIAKARIHAQKKMENAGSSEVQSRGLAQNILAITAENYLSARASSAGSVRLKATHQTVVCE